MRDLNSHCRHTNWLRHEDLLGVWHARIVSMTAEANTMPCILTSRCIRVQPLAASYNDHDPSKQRWTSTCVTCLTR